MCGLWSSRTLWDNEEIGIPRPRYFDFDCPRSYKIIQGLRIGLYFVGLLVLITTSPQVAASGMSRERMEKIWQSLHVWKSGFLMLPRKAEISWLIVNTKFQAFLWQSRYAERDKRSESVQDNGEEGGGGCHVFHRKAAYSFYRTYDGKANDYGEFPRHKEHKKHEQ